MTCAGRKEGGHTSVRLPPRTRPYSSACPLYWCPAPSASAPRGGLSGRPGRGRGSDWWPTRDLQQAGRDRRSGRNM